MKRKYDTLNEEINRIKSLFTEERLYGRLVEQSTTQITDEQSCGDAGGSWTSTTKTEGGLSTNTGLCKFTTHADYPDEAGCVGGAWDDATSSCTFTVVSYIAVKNGKNYKLLPAEEIKVKAKEEGDNIKWWKVNTIVDGYGYRLGVNKIISKLGATKEKNPDIFQKEIMILDDSRNIQGPYYYDPNVEVDSDTVIDDIDDDKETGKETLKETFKSCKEKLKSFAKIADKGQKKDEYIKNGNEDPTDLIEFCISKFHAQFNRWDFLRKGSSISKLLENWMPGFDLSDLEELKAKGGTIGQRYPIMYGSRKLGIVKKMGRNDYRIRTKMGEDIVKQSGGQVKWKNNKVKLAVEKAISMPDDQKIVFDKKLIPHKNYTWARFSLQDDI